MILHRVILLLLAVLFSLSAEGAMISGAGSTLAKPLYDKWGKTYKTVSADVIKYEDVGSGEGIKRVKAHRVDFGGTDQPLSDAELEKNHLLQFPTAVGAIVPVINLDDIEPGTLKLSGAVLADIYLGKIKKWNDRAITALNPNIKLPAIPIVVVHRSDASGSTYLFTTYLSEVSSAWKSKVGRNLTVHWPVGIGKKDSEALAQFVSLRKGAIGYVEYNYAQFMNFTQLQNKSGNFVQPSTLYLLRAVEGVNWANTRNFNTLLVNRPGEKIWPLTAMTFVLVPTTTDKTKLQHIFKFFDWGFNKGKELAFQLYYVPLPDDLVKLIKSRWPNYK